MTEHVRHSKVWDYDQTFDALFQAHLTAWILCLALDVGLMRASADREPNQIEQYMKSVCLTARSLLEDTLNQMAGDLGGVPVLNVMNNFGWVIRDTGHDHSGLSCDAADNDNTEEPQEKHRDA